MSTESVASHVAPAAATATHGGSGQAEAAEDAEPVLLETPPGSHGDGHQTPHPAQECVPGQPQHGVSLDAPGTSPLDMAFSAAEATLGQAAPIGSGSTGSGLAESRTSAVMQV
ncbi:hypothetical protein ACFWCA_21185 [Streptomyces phaeochromogenes]|uniref:hypothetical protein n=1 Tax=Streptomyces phaeochromogenes TaxID=1923 RepID=UPI003689A385